MYDINWSYIKGATFGRNVQTIVSVCLSKNWVAVKDNLLRKWEKNALLQNVLCENKLNDFILRLKYDKHIILWHQLWDKIKEICRNICVWALNHNTTAGNNLSLCSIVSNLSLINVFKQLWNVYIYCGGLKQVVYVIYETFKDYF